MTSVFIYFTLITLWSKLRSLVKPIVAPLVCIGLFLSATLECLGRVWRISVVVVNDAIPLQMEKLKLPFRSSLVFPEILIYYSVIQFFLRINHSNSALATTTKRGRDSGWRKAQSLLAWHLLREFTCLESMIKRSQQHSGDIWGPVPFIDKEYADCYVGFFLFFLCQLFLPDPITLQLSRHLPVHQVTKYKQTDHAIVLRAGTIVHTLLQCFFFAKTLIYTIFLLIFSKTETGEASNVSSS